MNDQASPAVETTEQKQDVVADSPKYCSGCGRDCAAIMERCPDCGSEQFDLTPGEKHQSYLARVAEEKAKVTEAVDTPEGEAFVTTVVAIASEGPQAEFASTPANCAEGGAIERKILEEVNGLSDEADSLEREWEEAKAHASELKKEFEAVVERLRKKIREAKSAGEFPIVDLAASANSAVQASPAQAADDDESWKSVAIDEAMPDLPKHIREKIQAAELPTMGDLANFVAVDGGKKRLIDIPGVGEKSAEKIEEAQMAFFERRRTAKPYPSPEETQAMLAKEPQRRLAHPGRVVDDNRLVRFHRLIRRLRLRKSPG